MSALTVANQLTLLRMLLIPALVILVLYGINGWALVVFIVAGVTDGLDGMLARWWGQRTSLGALLDPMADKLLVLSTFVVLSLPELDLPNQFPVWLTVLVISRDVIIVVTAAIVHFSLGHRTFTPTLLGKATTFVHILSATVALFLNWRGHTSVVFEFAIYATLSITLASGLHYILHATRTLGDSG